MIDKLGMNPWRVMDSEEAQAQPNGSPPMKVVTPSGKVGYVASDAIMPIGVRSALLHEGRRRQLERSRDTLAAATELRSAVPGPYKQVQGDGASYLPFGEGSRVIGVCEYLIVTATPRSSMGRWRVYAATCWSWRLGLHHLLG